MFQPFDAHYCHMDTAMKHTVPLPNRFKPSFVIFDIRALWCLSVRNYKWWLNPG